MSKAAIFGRLKDLNGLTILLTVICMVLCFSAMQYLQFVEMRAINSNLVELKVAVSAGRGGRGAQPSNANAPPPLLAEPKIVSLAGAATKGDKSAPLAVIEYSDFQCPYCAKFVQDTHPQLVAEYVERKLVLLAFRQLPLERIHPFAFGAAVAARCADEQGKFWPIHDLIFANPREISETDLRRKAEGLRLDMGLFSRCFGSSGPEAVRSDLATAKDLGITGTPTFLIGRVQPDGSVKVISKLSGAVPFERFKLALDNLLPKANGATQ